MQPQGGEITSLLAAIKRGDAGAEADLIALVYRDLHSLARRYMSRERPDHTLQPTALVNEAYLRMMSNRTGDWEDRRHFYATASIVMRRILVDHARERRAGKRTGGRQRVELTAFLAAANPLTDELLIVDEALTQLASFAPRQARLVELVYFGGLSEPEAAGVLQISTRTARRDWTAARAWLQVQLSGQKMQ